MPTATSSQNSALSLLTDSSLSKPVTPTDGLTLVSIDTLLNRSSAAAPIPATQGNGLTAQYYRDQTLTNLVLTRTDSVVNLDGSPDASVPSTHFSARWTGQVEAKFSEAYTFSTESDDGVRLWVDGKELVNNWTDHGVTENNGTIVLEAGHKYDIKLEYYQNEGGVTSKLRWSSLHQAKEIIPQSQLFSGAALSPNLSVSGASATTTYVSDLSWTSATNGWGSVEKDRSNGEDASGDGNTIALRGVTYSKGLGVHANSELTYDLNGNYTQFVADIGVDDEVRGQGSVNFQVWADGVQLFGSGTLTGSSSIQTVAVDVTGKKTLKLVVTPGSDAAYDHADWAGARLISSPAPLATPPAVTPAPPTIVVTPPPVVVAEPPTPTIVVTPPPVVVAEPPAIVVTPPPVVVAEPAAIVVTPPPVVVAEPAAIVVTPTVVTPTLAVPSLSSPATASTSLSPAWEDSTLPNEGHPSGVPSYYSWYDVPVVGWGNNPRTDWNAFTSWGQIYVESGWNPPANSNTRVQLRNIEAWYLSKSTGEWKLLQSATRVDGADFQEDFANNTAKAPDVRDESSNGGGTSITAGNGWNYHFWTDRVTMDPNDIGGIYTKFQARLILSDPSKPDDRASARYLGSAGADYWRSVSAPWAADWSNNGGVASGRFKFITPDWQNFSMETLPVDQLLKNPPPIKS